MRSLRIRQDLPKIMEIERTFPKKNRWLESAFLDRPGMPTVVTCVEPSPMDSQEILGYAVYQPCVESIELLRLVVAKKYRRQGLGRRMLAHFKQRINPQSCPTLSFWVPETNLPAHLFLKACGFKAVSIAHSIGNTNRPDDYVFEYNLFSGMMAA